MITMSGVQEQVREIVDRVVSEISVLYQSAIATALTGESFAPTRKTAKPTRSKPSTVKSEKAPRRSPEDFAKIADRLREYVKANPGQGIEAIAKGLGTRTAEITLSMKKLVKQSEVQTQGEKRATRYFPRGG